MPNQRSGNFFFQIYLVHFLSFKYISTDFESQDVNRRFSRVHIHETDSLTTVTALEPG